MPDDPTKDTKPDEPTSRLGRCDNEARQLQQFDDTHAKWLAGYLAGTTCDAERKSRVMGVMVSHFAVAQGSYDAAARQLLESPRAQSQMAVSKRASP